MALSFREFHLFQILNGFSQENKRFPLDRYLSHYFRSHRAVGSKDRRMIADTVYDLIRWRAPLDHFSIYPPTWESRYFVYSQTAWRERAQAASLPPHIALSFPQSYYSFLVAALGREKAEEFCALSNESAPTVVRVNGLKTTRENLLKSWERLYPVSPTTHSPWGIRFHKKVNFFAMKEFKEGLFEIQDEGSQLLADLMEVEPGDQVLDYCSGSGGKTLAFACRMQKRGQIYLHDKRKEILAEAKKRLRRAGVQNAQLLCYDDPKKGQLKHTMDWVLVDLPCSGSGTLRRNPDMKWKFQREELEQLLAEQRNIFKEALTFLKPKGKIVYGTCSVFPQENEDQAAYFQKHLSLSLERLFQTFPLHEGMDGFFGARLTF